MKRLEFSDKQKALIYQRDKGLCAFSGKILWIFFYGVSIRWDSDWVDHIKPAMKGGDNSIENGICASSFYNSKKKDNSHDNKFFFKNGKPTEYFFIVDGNFSQDLGFYLKNMQNIHFSDWYFNRILKNIMLAVDILNNPYDVNGNLVKRTEKYWCKAGFKKLEEYRKIIKKENIESFITRLYIDKNNLGEDQKILLKIINSDSLDDLLDITKKLLPFYKKSIYYFEKLEKINTLEDIEFLEKEIKNEKNIGLQDKINIKNNIENLKIIYN